MWVTLYIYIHIKTPLVKKRRTVLRDCIANIKGDASGCSIFSLECLIQSADIYITGQECACETCYKFNASYWPHVWALYEE